MSLPSFVKCKVRGSGAGRSEVNSGGSGNVRRFSQRAVPASKVSTDTKNAMEHTQCLLIEKSHITTVGNRQNSTGAVERDIMDRAVEHIYPDFML